MHLTVICSLLKRNFKPTHTHAFTKQAKGNDVGTITQHVMGTNFNYFMSVDAVTCVNRLLAVIEQAQRSAAGTGVTASCAWKSNWSSVS